MQESRRSAITVPGLLSGEDGQTAMVEAAGLDGVCTDRNLNVLKVFGQTTAYLKNKNFVFDLSQLLPDEVSLIVKAAAYEALKSQRRVALSDLDFSSNGRQYQHSVNIVISPFFADSTGDPQLLVLFSSNKTKTKVRSLRAPVDIQHLTRRYVAGLESELAAVKNKLETAYSLINSSNENVQSFNEELLSAN